MIPIPGQLISNNVLAELEYVDDLRYFDGPLLSHFIGPRDVHYLAYWVDVSQTCNRWMMMKITRDEVVELREATIDELDVDENDPDAKRRNSQQFEQTLKRIFEAHADELVYFVDRDAESLVIATSAIILRGAPVGYRPRFVTLKTF